MKKLFRRLLTWLHSLRRRDKIMYIGGSDTLPPPLPREEETEVIARLEQGDPQAGRRSSSGICGWWCISPDGLKTPASTSRT